MRIRITDGELDYYAKAKRDGSRVRVQGLNWRVVGITADMLSGVIGHGMGDPREAARVNPTPRRLAQWWVELVEAG